VDLVEVDVRLSLTKPINHVQMYCILIYTFFLLQNEVHLRFVFQMVFYSPSLNQKQVVAVFPSKYDIHQVRFWSVFYRIGYIISLFVRPA
jgi:hypothetical protein